MKTSPRIGIIDDVLLELEVMDKAQLFDAIERFLSERHGLLKAHIAERLNEREKLGSTALGYGVAIPHARIPDLKQTLIAFVRPKFPLEFDAPDSKPVSDILVLLVPEHADQTHLALLAHVAHLFSTPAFRSALRQSEDALAVSCVFAQWKNASFDSFCVAA